MHLQHGSPPGEKEIFVSELLTRANYILYHVRGYTCIDNRHLQTEETKGVSFHGIHIPIRAAAAGASAGAVVARHDFHSADLAYLHRREKERKTDKQISRK
ncbi:hypothetical protein M0804_001918 [Polistes exclamans]|nr:hypothetical protein M0804_001918 [Polistes exclamans]